MAKEKYLPKLPFGEGHMSWADDKQELIYYRKTINVNGKKKRLFVSAKTPGEVMKLMREKEVAAKKDLMVIASNDKYATLEVRMRDWLNLFKAQEVNARTFDRIDSTFTTHILNSNLGTMREDSVTSEDIQSFFNNLCKHKQNGEIFENEPLSYSSKKKIYELLSQYFNNRYLEAPHLNPMRKVTKPRKSDEEVFESNEELIIWDDDEMEKLTKVAMMEWRVGVEGYKNGPLIAFLMWIFCRVGECLALQWKDIDFENETVTISKSYSRSKIRTGAKAGQYEYKIAPTKTKTKRTVEMCKRAVDAIKKYKEIKAPESDEEYVCDTGSGIMSVTSITRTYEAMIAFADLPKEKHVTIHGLRHSGISFFLRHGVPVEVVSKLAGHSSIDITQNTYYQVLKSQRRTAIDDLNRCLEDSFKKDGEGQ